MTLKARIQADLMSAMKSKQEIKLSALRLLKASIMKFEVSGAQKAEATDEQILSLIEKEAKQRKDSIAAFESGGRSDLAEKEKSELAVLIEYLPAQLSEEELESIVRQTMQEVAAQSKNDFGRVMKALMPKVKGKAEGATVSKLLQKLLP